MLKQGREFSPADGSDVVIVNEAMAQNIWRTASPLGRRIKFGDKPWRTVIGVAPNINGGGIGGPGTPVAYVPFSSGPGQDMALAISTSGNPAPLAAELRAAVHAVDPDQP